MKPTIIILALTLLSCSNKNHVEESLINYHNNLGQSVKIEKLEYRKVPENWADSVRWMTTIDSWYYYKTQAIEYKYSGRLIAANASELMSEAHKSKIDSLHDAFRSKNRDSTMFKCDYIAHFVGGVDYRDTMSVVLDKNLRVVWSNK